MGAAENKQLLQHIFAEMSNGNPNPFLEGMADDIRWTVIGTTKFSRTFVGKQAVLNELLGSVISEIDGQIRVTADRFIADGDLVVVEARGHSTTRTGKEYNNTYCWIYRIADGKVQEVTEYLDTELVTETFGR
jgi:uncharacterized protein